MTDQDALPTPDALDALIDQLLDCGGVLSQIISHMSEFEASGLALPDTPPVLELAHSVIRGVLDEVSQRHSEDEIRVSAAIVEEVTSAMCDQIFVIPPEELRRMRGGSPTRNSRRRRQSSHRPPRRHG
ncbi:MAG: hypothetical protein WCD11_11895 [Solirubrobacteraceae bacterium]